MGRSTLGFIWAAVVRYSFPGGSWSLCMPDHFQVFFLVFLPWFSAWDSFCLIFTLSGLICFSIMVGWRWWGETSVLVPLDNAVRVQLFSGVMALIGVSWGTFAPLSDVGCSPSVEVAVFCPVGKLVGGVRSPCSVGSFCEGSSPSSSKSDFGGSSQGYYPPQSGVRNPFLVFPCRVLESI